MVQRDDLRLLRESVFAIHIMVGEINRVASLVADACNSESPEENVRAFLRTHKDTLESVMAIFENNDGCYHGEQLHFAADVYDELKSYFAEESPAGS